MMLLLLAHVNKDRSYCTALGKILADTTYQSVVISGQGTPQPHQHQLVLNLKEPEKEVGPDTSPLELQHVV